MAGRQGRVLRVKACAKINLALRVLGVRPDGFHELHTTFQSLALHDTLTFGIGGSSEGIRIVCDDPACPTGSANLVWRAAELAWRAAGRAGAPRGVHVRIQKRIPMQAGLGGGSSDAAAALRACARLWRLKHADLAGLAAALGADVPFFLHGGTAAGTGRGDVIEPLDDRPARWVVLVFPDFGVSTKDAFGWLDGQRPHPGRGPEALNDLQAVVEAHHPEIGRIVKALGRAGASAAAMSGSGSAVFGLFGTRAPAVAAAARLATARRRALVTRTIGGARYRLFSQPAPG